SRRVLLSFPTRRSSDLSWISTPLTLATTGSLCDRAGPAGSTAKSAAAIKASALARRAPSPDPKDAPWVAGQVSGWAGMAILCGRSEEHTSELQSQSNLV